MLLSTHTLEPDDPTPDKQAERPPSDTFFSLLPIFALVLIGYFLLIRPVKKQEKERKALLSALKKNQKVITQGGIIGIIANVNEKDEEVTLKVDESSNVRIKVLRSSIVRVMTSADDAATDSVKQAT